MCGIKTAAGDKRYSHHAVLS